MKYIMFDWLIDWLSRFCSGIAYSSNSTAKKFYWLWNYWCNWNSAWWKCWKFVIRCHFNAWPLTSLPAEKLSPFLNTNKRVYLCRSVSLFFAVNCICRKAYFHDNVKLDDGYFMANCNSCGEWYHKKCMNIPVKVFRDEKHHIQWKCSVCRK